MRDVLVFASLVIVSAGCGSDPSAQGEPHGVGTARSAIIGGALDPGDPSVIELLYVAQLSPSQCNGDSSCMQTSCLDATGQPCTSGASCLCGVGAVCSGELIGPHSVVTAGHCTDLTAGGELSGEGGPALTLCTSPADVMALSSGLVPSSGCNLDVLVLFDNVCTSTTLMGACEQTLIQSGDYIIGDQLVNPGFNASASSNFPDSAADTDNDIGLVRLSSSTLVNGRPEPGVLLFNRADLGSQCADLGALKSVGYGITEPTQGSSALSGLKYTVTHDAKVKDAWHIEADGAQADPLQTCGVGSGEEPTCLGDSGGPSFNSAGAIVGVTSFGDQACSTIGVSTRLDAYAPWIDSTMASWGDPTNGTTAPADGGSTIDTGAPSGADASAANVNASASTGEGGVPTQADEAGTDGTAQASASGGCSVGVAAPGDRRTGALAPLLIVVAAGVRRWRRVASSLRSTCAFDGDAQRR